MLLPYVLGSHRNTLVRDSASRLVVSIAENLGPGRVLSGIRDITDRILVASAQFLRDQSQYTRYQRLTMNLYPNHLLISADNKNGLENIGSCIDMQMHACQQQHHASLADVTV